MTSTTVNGPPHLSDQEWAVLREVLDTAIADLGDEFHGMDGPGQRHARTQRQLLLRELRDRAAGPRARHRVADSHSGFFIRKDFA